MKRQEYIDALRALADRLEKHPHAPVPSVGKSEIIPFLVFAYTREDLSHAAECYGATGTTNSRGEFRMEARVNGLYVRIVPMDEAENKNAACVGAQAAGVTGER